MRNFELLRSRLASHEDLERAASLCAWDQQTFMPRGAAAARSEQLATLTRLAHEMLIAAETERLLDLAAAEVAPLPDDSDEARLVRVARRDFELAHRIPGALVEELARAVSVAFEKWAEARSDCDFEQFRPHLETVLELTRRKAEALTYKDCIYDALLDIFEPGLTTARVQELFDRLKVGLVPLIRLIGERVDRVDDSLLLRSFDAETQFDFSVELLRQIGFDFHHGRQDRSLHPFTTSFSIRDVRLTTRVQEHRLSSCLFGTLHEGGHGLYDQGVSIDFERTPLGHGASLGVHESQSRTWENLIGRSRPFWQWCFPRLRDAFPAALAGADVENFYRAVNRVMPSFIRVEADEVTYNMHVLLRFELEVAMLTGRLKARDLPEAWNAGMMEYLGVTPPDAARGVLQDVHWADGLIGYFPTYTLGNILSVQIFDALRRDVSDVDRRIAAGEFGGILAWLRANVYRHGRKFTPSELMRRVTGEDIRVEPYVGYLSAKYGEIYGLSPAPAGQNRTDL